jgi:hypothetical protein
LQSQSLQFSGFDLLCTTTTTIIIIIITADQPSAPASLKMFHLCRPNCREEKKKVSK